MSPYPLFGSRIFSRSQREALGKELAHPIFRIIKRAPRPESSYEAGVTSLRYKLEMKSRILSGDFSDIVENLRWQHGIIDSA